MPLAGNGLLGLTTAEATRRLAEYGPNVPPQPPSASIGGIILRTLKEPMFFLLMAAALYSQMLTMSGLPYAVGQWLQQAQLGFLAVLIGYLIVLLVLGCFLDSVSIMLIVLALIDVVMISNLLVMVIVGGWETFVSRLELEHHPDQPEWLSHVNAGVLKVKLATAIIGISLIHLLKTFINAEHYTEKVLLWQTLIHLSFVVSALAIAFTERITHPPEKDH